MNKLVLTLVVCLGLVSSAAAVVTTAVGACPKGVKPGQSWYPKGCQKCDCNKGSYQCYTCDSVSFPPECGVTYDTTKKYPDCCIPRLDCPQYSEGGETVYKLPTLNNGI